MSMSAAYGPTKAMIELIRSAFDHGVTPFDTVESYRPFMYELGVRPRSHPT